MVAMWKWGSGSRGASHVAAPDGSTNPNGSTGTGRQAELERRVAALEAWEAGLVEHRRAAEAMLAAAELRDELADARDVAADLRERHGDLSEFMARHGEYGHDWPERRAAAIDRELAKEDRAAARHDRRALADAFLERARTPRPPADTPAPVGAGSSSRPSG